MGRFLSLDPLADAGGQQVLSPYHAMGCNPVSMVDPLGLRAGLFPETQGAGGPTQMDIALMTPPTILLDRMYGFGNDPWTMMNRGALNDYEAKMAKDQRYSEMVTGLIIRARYGYHVGLEKQRGAPNHTNDGVDLTGLIAYNGSNVAQFMQQADNRWGTMYIISNVDEDAGWTDGHAWIRLEGLDGTVTTMSLWGNRGTQEFWTDLEKDFGYGSVSTSTIITESQYQKIGSFNSISDNINWTISNTCAGYSANLWNYVTGGSLSAKDNLGTTTPRSLSESIIKYQGIQSGRKNGKDGSSW